MPTFNSWSALEKAVQQKHRDAMQATEQRSHMSALENADEFYSQGNPVMYERTGTYGDAPDSTGVTGGGNKLHTEIYMNPNGHGYTTGTFSAQEVWQAAEVGSAGVLGLSGRWAETESDVKKIINEEFGKRFSK